MKGIGRKSLFAATAAVFVKHVQSSELTSTCLSLPDGTGTIQTLCGHDLALAGSLESQFNIFSAATVAKECYGAGCQLLPNPSSVNLNGVSFNAPRIDAHPPTTSLCNTGDYDSCSSRIDIDLSRCVNHCYIQPHTHTHTTTHPPTHTHTH
jgi:hypothetical protein